jgi:hypothetical protein
MTDLLALVTETDEMANFVEVCLRALMNIPSMRWARKFVDHIVVVRSVFSSSFMNLTFLFFLAFE